uniref:Zinc transporter ZIP11 n=3 Tax=Tetraodon nigroviridis TaxID=99883 RepID=H3CES6_TETNG
MLEGYSPVVQALLGTLFTWGLTAAGAALVFVFSSHQKAFKDGFLNCAFSVMLAASYWSLLAPAIDMAEDSGKYGSFAFLPVAVGFSFGAAFVYFADLALPLLGVGTDPHLAFALPHDSKQTKEKAEDPSLQQLDEEMSIRIGRAGTLSGFVQRKKKKTNCFQSGIKPAASVRVKKGTSGGSSFTRVSLCTYTIKISLFTEGLAVGVGFGAIGKTPSATFESARNLAIGIGIQNFPEGLAVSLPLRGAGVSAWTAFWYGQLSGMVEPLAGLLGAFAVVLAEPLLPYALAFAAGAMVYVVVDDIIPEAQVSGNGKLASWTSILGFVVMMSLDVGLG